MKDFNNSTKFEAFWKSHQDDLLAVLKEMQGNIPQFDLPEMMESFYNRRVVRFYFVPCPFMKTMGTHVEIQDVDGNWTFYYIAGGNIFKNKFSNISTAFHEFSHCFIEPVSAEYYEQISNLDYLYKPLKNDLSKMGYQINERGPVMVFQFLLSGFLAFISWSMALPQERLEKGKRETVLDRVVHIDKEPILNIPDLLRWCDQLNLTKSRVNIGDCELYVEEEGDGMPLVLLHGGPGGTHHSFHPEFSRAIGNVNIIISLREKR